MPSERVMEYRRLLAEWRMAREAAGGELDDDAEEDWTNRCHEVWEQMTAEEWDEVK